MKVHELENAPTCSVTRAFFKINKATPVACGWTGAVIEKVTRVFGQE